MKYIRQFGMILAITCAGEVLKYLIQLPVPGSVYGLILLLILLLCKRVRLEEVKETGEFLVEIMPLMFIPAAAGLVTSWELLRELLFPLCVMIPLSTSFVVFVTGKVTDIMMDKKKEGK